MPFDLNSHLQSLGPSIGGLHHITDPIHAAHYLGHVLKTEHGIRFGHGSEHYGSITHDGIIRDASGKTVGRLHSDHVEGLGGDHIHSHGRDPFATALKYLKDHAKQSEQ